MESRSVLRATRNVALRLTGLSALLVLASCATGPDELERWNRTSQELMSADLAYEYKPIDATSLPGRDRASADAIVEKTCLVHRKASFDQFRRTFLTAPDIALVSSRDQFQRLSRTFDPDVSSCLERLGLRGSVYWRWNGERLPTERFAQLVMTHAASRPVQRSGLVPVGGCGSRGGPGYRKANGQCASWGK